MSEDGKPCRREVPRQAPEDALPDPPRDVVRFLAWLKKRGRVRRIEDCRRVCARLGLELGALQGALAPDYLCVFRTGGGGRVVRLMDLPWADNCMERHGLEVPHHGQPVRRRRRTE